MNKEVNYREVLEYTQGILNTVRTPFLILDKDLKIVMASRSFYRTFGEKEETTLGKSIYIISDRRWNIPKLKTLLESKLDKVDMQEDFEMDVDLPNVGKRTLLMNAMWIKRVLGEPLFIFLSIEDYTSRKDFYQQLTDSEERFRRLFETAGDGLLLIHKERGSILKANKSASTLTGYSNEELEKMTLWQIGTVKNKSEFLVLSQQLEADGYALINDIKINTKNGEGCNTDVHLVDRAAVIQCNIRDITKRKAAEDLIKEHIREIEIYSRHTTDREIKMIELKKTIVDLKSQLNALLSK